MSKVVYPGTFDPISLGHQSIVKRCVRLFDEVIIAVAVDTPKTTLFSIEERVKLVKESFKREAKVEVKLFSGLLVNFLEEEGIFTIVRGMRVLSDFEFEFQMAVTNRTLDKRVETLFMLPDEGFGYMNSRLIRELHQLGGDVSSFVAPHVYDACQKIGRKLP